MVIAGAILDFAVVAGDMGCVANYSIAYRMKLSRRCLGKLFVLGTDRILDWN